MRSILTVDEIKRKIKSLNKIQLIIYKQEVREYLKCHLNTLNRDYN